MDVTRLQASIHGSKYRDEALRVLNGEGVARTRGSHEANRPNLFLGMFVFDALLGGYRGAPSRRLSRREDWKSVIGADVLYNLSK